MANPLRFLARRTALSLADLLVSGPLVRWTWSSLSVEELRGGLNEFRPVDRETILEMQQGRYLLASKLVDTHGASPFSVPVAHDDWLDDLHTFAWLRHFRDARTSDERAFARTLALDWIGRHGRFDRDTWALSICARRVLNWLRHLNILMSGATPEQGTTILRSLRLQVQSLKLRSVVAADPVEALLATLALLAFAVTNDRSEAEIIRRLDRSLRLLEDQLDDDGLHRSRSAKVQLQLIVELTSLRHLLGHSYEPQGDELTQTIETMHRALDAISLGTGEPGYFNGTGQLPHDLIVAVQAQSPSRARATGVVGGYGRLLSGRSIVVADSGAVPEPDFSGAAHASALAFEFSHGRDLVVCNCGPAPAGLEGSALLFRQGVAHSAPTINALSAAQLVKSGPLAGRLVPIGDAPEVLADEADHSLLLRTHGYEDRFGVTIERRLTLLAEGKTLVGQDRLLPQGRNVSGHCSIRFHLAPQTDVVARDDILRLSLGSGAVWTFLWEGADMRLEDSVRQSAYFGFHRTRQIVLDAAVADTSEVSWIFTLDEG